MLGFLVVTSKLGFFIDLISHVYSSLRVVKYMTFLIHIYMLILTPKLFYISYQIDDTI